MNPLRRTILLAAHGAGDGSDANRRVEAIRAEVARRRPELEVFAAFNLGSPGFTEALDASTGGSTTVVPMMTSRGHFVGERLPAALARSARSATTTVEIAPPVGTVRSLVRRVVARAVEAARDTTDAPAVIVVGHGTRRTATSGDATRNLAAEIAASLPDASVAAAFLDEPPLLENVALAIDRRRWIVVPFLLGGGDHARRDIAERLGAAIDRSGRGRAAPTIALLPALADDTVLHELVDATLELVDGHAPDRVHRVGTRGSPLARRQAAMAIEALAAAGLRTTIVEIATRGDLDQRTPLDGFDGDGVFTDELEAALAAGEIDLAVHSLKDLPLRAGRETIVAAHLVRGAADEVLVARAGSTLRTLPAGARIGTSSPRRTAQLLAERPDLVAVAMRGPVDRRLATVAEGGLDGTILAAAGIERLGAVDRINERFALDRFVPEAGQGAIVITARIDDVAALAACARIDHAPTRAAVDAERAVSRAVQAHQDWIAAAHATVVDGDPVGVRLRVRAIARGDGSMRDAVVEGSSVDAAVAKAMAALALHRGPRRTIGRVHLVGAGPGDPGLLTTRGAALLAGADVVVHDRLVSDDVLDLARAGAELVDAGKVPGGDAMPQETINRLLVEHARRGRTVIRLKGGDPFVFGRGSEELDACRAAGVPCEVVPGVSSAIAGPAAAGIPVTARGVARTFVVATARGGDGEAAIDLDYAALAAMDTIVLLMGRARLDEVAHGLVAAGRDADTPAAIVERATLPAQRTVVATLGTIATAADDAGIAPPAVVVVGETVRRAATSTGEPRLLAGRRIVVTRPRSAGAELAAALRVRGGEVIECPLIAIEYPDPPPAPPDPGSFDWLVVTSLHGVRGLWRALERSGLDGRALRGVRIAAIGPRTASELWEIGRLRADLVPDEHRAEALVRTMAARWSGMSPSPRVLFPCGTLAREETAAGLRELGAAVTEVIVYDTVPAPPSETARRRIARGVDAVLLHSPSAARSLVAHAVPIDGAAVVCVGPTTAAAAARLGLPRPLVPASYGDAGVLATLEAMFGDGATADSAPEPELASIDGGGRR